MSLIKLFVIITLVVLYKYVSNLSKYKKVSSFTDEYYMAVETFDTPAFNESTELFRSLREQKPIIEGLIIGANVQIPIRSIIVPDYQHGVANRLKVNSLDYMLNPDQPRVIGAVIETLDYTMGVYKQRAKDSYNPLYWINSFLFLPQKTLNYFGVNSTNIFTKVLNIVWWIFNVFLSLYSDNVRHFISSFFSN